MADRAWAEIAIGGKADYATLERLLAAEGHNLTEAVEANGAQLGGEGAYIEDGRLIVADTQKVGGMFEELEAGLVDAGIAFDRLGGSYSGQWADSLAHFRPGMREPVEYVTDADHSDGYVPVKALRAAMETLGANLEASPLDLQGAARAAFARWRDVAPVIPELPPFELVDTVVEL
jgi:hypothetical protein